MTLLTRPITSCDASSAPHNDAIDDLRAYDVIPARQPLQRWANRRPDCRPGCRKCFRQTLTAQREKLRHITGRLVGSRMNQPPTAVQPLK